MSDEEHDFGKVYNIDLDNFDFDGCYEFVKNHIGDGKSIGRYLFMYFEEVHGCKSTRGPAAKLRSIIRQLLRDGGVYESR